MGKEKVTSETLLDKCTNRVCTYNEDCFCHLPSIMLGDDGKCIYSREENKNEKAEENLG